MVPSDAPGPADAPVSYDRGMLDPTFRRIELPAGIEEAGFAYGRACAHLLEEDRLGRYLDALAALKRTDREWMAVHAEAWAARLPGHYRRQMAAYRGALAAMFGLPEDRVSAVLAMVDRGGVVEA